MCLKGRFMDYYKKLFDLVLDINENSKFTAAFRFVPFEFKDGTRQIGILVDLLRNGNNIYSKHIENSTNNDIEMIINEIKETMAMNSKYVVSYESSYLTVKREFDTKNKAKIFSNDLYNLYNISADILEVPLDE